MSRFERAVSRMSPVARMNLELAIVVRRLITAHYQDRLIVARAQARIKLARLRREAGLP